MAANTLTGILQKNSDFIIDVSKQKYTGHSIIHKFGRNPAVPNGSFEFISNLGVAAPPFLTAPDTVRVKAGGNAADTSGGAGAQQIVISGIDSNLNEATESIVLAGASASASTTTQFWRVFRATVTHCGTYATAYNTGNIVIEDTSATTDLIMIAATEGQTQYGAFCLPTGFKAILLTTDLYVDSSQATDIIMYRRDNMNVTTPPVSPRRIVHYWDGVVGSLSYKPRGTDIVLPGLTDIWLEASGSGGTSQVSVHFELYCYRQNQSPNEI